MRPVRLMILRTMGRARVAFTNALATTCFLGVVSGLFALSDPGPHLVRFRGSHSAFFMRLSGNERMER